jgi:hypothetical protein
MVAVNQAQHAVLHDVQGVFAIAGGERGHPVCTMLDRGKKRIEGPTIVQNPRT